MLRTRSGTLLLVPVVLGFFAGCSKPAQVRQTPPPEPPPRPSFQVPAGCEAPVAGTFAHEGRRDWEYEAQDDGVTLQLTVRRAATAGAQAQAGPRIELRRTDNGFVGHARAQVFAGGTECAVQFPTRVVACEELALTLQSVGELAVDERSCEVADLAPDAVWHEHRLVRLPPPQEAPAEEAPPGQ